MTSTTSLAVDSIIEAAQQNPGSSSFEQWRKANVAQLSTTLWPGKKTENWKYTSLAGIDADVFKPLATPSTETTTENDADIIAVDGQLILSERLQQISGLTVTLLSNASDAQLQQVDSIASRSNDQPFAQFNRATTLEGVVIEVADNVVIEQAISIYVASSAGSNGLLNTRVFFEVGENSSLTVLENIADLSESACNNSIVELDLKTNANVQWVRQACSDNAQYGIHGLHIRQKQHSKMKIFPLIGAGKLSRHDIRCHLVEPAAELEIYGVFLSNEKNHSDLQVCVEHAAPHCTSYQDIKGLASDNGLAVFNGRIHIHEGAVKTQADLSNKNLLLSKSAGINSKPELEIYNDDVKCSHGTTVGQLDENAVFYLQSRGIPQKQACNLLAQGFIGEVIAKAPEAVIESGVADQLLQRLHFEENEK